MFRVSLIFVLFSPLLFIRSATKRKREEWWHGKREVREAQRMQEIVYESKWRESGEWVCFAQACSFHKSLSRNRYFPISLFCSKIILNEVVQWMLIVLNDWMIECFSSFFSHIYWRLIKIFVIKSNLLLNSVIEQYLCFCFSGP